MQITIPYKKALANFVFLESADNSLVLPMHRTHFVMQMNMNEAKAMVKTVEAKQKRWREVLQVHPAAELLPTMNELELAELASDIESRWRRERIALYEGKVLDGRNRLDALERIGRGVFDGCGNPSRDYFEHLPPGTDPVAYVMSKNVRRRHLTAEQKRRIIASLVKLAPDKSNRSIAATVGASHHTVAVVRAEAEATGQIAQFTLTEGKDGKRRPVHRDGRNQRDSIGVNLGQLPTLWREVETQASAGNGTRVKMALDRLILEATRITKSVSLA